MLDEPDQINNSFGNAGETLTGAKLFQTLWGQCTLDVDLRISQALSKTRGRDARLLGLLGLTGTALTEFEFIQARPSDHQSWG